MRPRKNACVFKIVELVQVVFCRVSVNSMQLFASEVQYQEGTEEKSEL